MNRLQMTACFFVNVATAVAYGGNANAAIMLTAASTNNNETIIDTLPTAGEPGAGEWYVLFGATSDPVSENGYVTGDMASLPSYLTYSTSGNRYIKTNNSDITADGTVYNTAALVSGGDPSFTITLGAGAPSAFRLGVLVQNDSGQDSWDIEATSSSGSSVTIQNRFQPNPINGFYFIDVADASSGDTVTIENNETMGGFTFDVIPEPASLSLLGAGLILTMSRRRA